MKLTASDLVKAIASLPKNRAYNYYEDKTGTKISIESIEKPEGPIRLRRWNPKRGKGYDDAASVSVSTNSIWRIANGIVADVPFHIDRILGASFNYRSAIETLLAHTPEFYICKPGRIESKSGTSAVKEGHKHLIWIPGTPHANGEIQEWKTEIVISESPGIQNMYDSLKFPGPPSEEMPIETQRRHTQIQIAIVEIGNHLGFRTYIARNDQGIIYRDKAIGEMDGVVVDLGSEQIITSYGEGVTAASLIDCVWFRNARFMPAVIEVEHSTGVTSGLSRMKNFQDSIPPIATRWVIAAPDEIRDKVVKECNKPQFSSLNAQFFPYSAIEELYSLCKRRNIRGVDDSFLDCFMEPMTEPPRGSLN